MKFHERFDIEVGIEDARRRFVNRVYNQFILKFLYQLRSDDVRYDIDVAIATALGDRYLHHKPIDELIGKDFLRNLRAIEAVISKFPAIRLNPPVLKIGVVNIKATYRAPFPLLKYLSSKK